MHKNMYKKTIYAIREDSNDSDSDNKGSKQVWCICRSTDSSRFMIACDSCEEWYHGDCVNITPKMAESISKYFCTWCQKKNSTLKIVYKSTPLVSRPKEKFEKYDKKEKFERFDKAIKVEKLERLVRPKIEEKLTAPPVKTYKIKKSTNCGECMGCFRKVDCNLCQNCRSKTGLGCLARMCQRRQTPVVEKVVKSQEKLMLTKLPLDFIPAKVAPPKKVIVTKPPQSQHTSAPSSSSSNCSEPTTRSMKRPVSPSTSSDSGSNVSSSNKPKAYPLPPLKKPKFNEMKPLEKPQQIPQHVYHVASRASADSEEDDEDDDDEAESSSSDKSEDSEDFPSDIGGRAARFVHTRPIKKPKIKHSTKKTAKKSKIIVANHTNDAHFVQRRCTRKSEPEPIKNYKSFDCYNIGCNKPSRMGSKYCSDECGISLAEQRLLKYLPERITNWNNSVSISEEKDKQARSEIKEELQTIHYNLDILNASHQDLTEFIERWRSTYSATNVVDCGVNEDNVQCVSCDMMVNSLKALAHMENCYQKIEGQTMVFADYEDAPIGTKLFCDYYDNNIRGYCKRLAALCDHHKDPKVDPKTICAFPLSVNEKSDKVCMTAKIKCNRHINWERIQRAVIDMNRYRLLVRYSDLQMEDKRLKQGLSQRGGVMALLTHETIDHQPLKPMLPITAIDGTKRMKKFTKAVCI